MVANVPELHAVSPRGPSLVVRLWQSDVGLAFRASRTTQVAVAATALMVLAAAAAPLIAPYDPFDPATLDLTDGFIPPLGRGADGDLFLLGTDSQGRDVLSAILYGSRISILVGLLSMLFAVTVGVGAGLIAGWVGGVVDAVIMRITDIQLTFPVILLALLVFGVARGVIPDAERANVAIAVLVLAIGLSNWAQFARTVRGATLVEKEKEYVQAARVIGIPPLLILLRHVLPNVMRPVLVIATISFALAILEESTLSFLGVGVPPTQPSLGTLIRLGQQFVFSGEWWILFFPAMALVLLALAVNLLGDWLRDVLDPKLR